MQRFEAVSIIGAVKALETTSENDESVSTAIVLVDVKTGMF